MFSDRVASMFSVIELFFGIGGQDEFYSRNNFKDVFQVRSLALCWGAFYTKLGDSLSPSRSVCHKGSNCQGKWKFSRQWIEKWCCRSLKKWLKSFKWNNRHLGDGKLARPLRRRHSFHHARFESVSNIRKSNVWIFRGAAATRRRGQARNVRCSSKARHSRGSLQGLYIVSPVVSFESLPRWARQLVAWASFKPHWSLTSPPWAPLSHLFRCSIILKSNIRS